MKSLMALILFTYAVGTFARDVRCEAYCGFFSTDGIMEYTATDGKSLSSTGKNKTLAYEALTKKCQDINEGYQLYTNSHYDDFATVKSACH